MKRNSLPTHVFLGILLIAGAVFAGRGSLSAQRSPGATDEFKPRAYLPLLIDDSQIYDMAYFIVGEGELYEVWQYIFNEDRESQARHQTQFEGTQFEEDVPFYHTKGNELSAEWEELWIDDEFVYRGTDTSPGSGLYYTLREDSQYGSKWSPRYWKVGDIFERNPDVTFYYKGNCAVDRQYPDQSWLKFEAYYPEYTFDAGGPDPITVQSVVELIWISRFGQEEHYFYAQEHGLVGWSNNHGDFSRISEIHKPGDRFDNNREVIHCLDTGSRPPAAVPNFPPSPLKAPYRVK